MLMGRRTRHCCSYAAIAAFWLFGVVRDALAEGPSPNLSFRVLVEETGCPHDTFTHQVLRRAPSAKLATPNEPALSMAVKLRTEPGIVRGRLTLLEPNGVVTERDVTGASCAEVTAALALIAAVFLDPNATADEPPKVPPRADPRPDAAEAQGVWRLGGGPAVGVHGATAPRFTPGLALVLEAALERDRGLSPLFSVSLMRGLTSRVEVQTSVATLRFMAARLQACPVAWPRASNLTFRPCGLIEAGVLDAAGTETSDPQRVRTPWLAPGGALRAELNLSTILMIALDAGFVVPLFRPEFYFDPDAPETVAFEVPPIGSTGHLGVLARFE
jgi:hypothetical protein